MLRFYCLALVRPSAVPWSWHCASQQGHQVRARPPQGCRAGAETQKHGKGCPSGLHSHWSSPGSLQEAHGEAGVSQQLAASLDCSQQELLSEAGPVLAGGCVRLMATLGDASLGVHLSAGWEAVFSLCRALWVLRSNTLYFCATRHGRTPSSFVRRLEKEIWIKELLLLDLRVFCMIAQRELSFSSAVARRAAVWCHTLFSLLQFWFTL